MSSPITSYEQRIETGNGLANKIRDSFDRWQERFALENPRLIERYKKGELVILLKFSTGLVAEEYVMLFQGKTDIGDVQYPWVGFRRRM